MQTLEQDIRAFVHNSFLIGQDAGALGGDDSFLERGIIDSTGVLELVAFLEQNYSIRIADDELVPENLDSVAQVAAFVRRKRDAAAIGSAA